MHRITCIFLFTIICLSMISLSHAQDYDIDIEMDIPDTLFLNENVLLEIDLRNKDTVAYSSNIIINFMVADTIPSNIPADLVISFADTTPVTIPPDSSFEIQKNLFVDPLIFDVNEPNIIIIWPTTANNAIKFNMHMQEVRVEWPVGIVPIKNKKAFSLHPNPITDKLNIYLSNDLGNINNLKIYNSLGLIVKSVIIKDTFADVLTIDLKNDKNNNNFYQGVYFIVLEGKTGVGIQKFILSK